MRYLRLSLAIVSVSLRRTLAYRANLMAETLVSVVNVAMSLAILQSIHQIAGTLGGWSQSETKVLLGFYLVASGILGSCIEPNLGWFRDQVTQGQLDDILLRPVSAMYLASLGSCSPLSLTQSVVGLVILAIEMLRTRLELTFLNLLLALATFASGCVCIWAIRLILASLAFWAPSLQPDVGFKAVWEFGRYPVTIYQRPIRLALTYAIPIAAISTIPTQVLVAKLDWDQVIGSIVISAVAVILAREVWLAGLRRYSSATS